jgi:predicted dienelactone hydrolase
MSRRGFITHAVGLAGGVAAASFPYRAAQASASPLAGHRVVDLDLLDTDRRRPVPSRLYLPLRASPAQPVPLVVFSQGLGGSRMGYRYLGSHWADEGIASLHPQHVGSDSRVWQGNPLELVQRLQAAASESEALARVLDLRYAIDKVLASESAALIDVARMAVAGHSYGANTAMLVAGSRVSTANTGVTDLRDPRIRAAILISAPPFVGQGPAEQVLGSISMPTLHVTSLEDTVNIPGYRSTVEDRIAVFHAMRASPRTLAVFNTGGHSIFTDRTTLSGPDITARIKGATRELSTLFLQQELPRAGRMTGLDGDGAPATALLAPSEAQLTHDGSQGIGQWLLRHQDLLDRFVMPGGATVSQWPKPGTR